MKHHEQRAQAQRRARQLLNLIASASRDQRSSGLSDLAGEARIGILLQWGVGDAVLALPLLSGLRGALPAAKLELIGKPWLGELFRHTGLCDATHTLVPPWTRRARKYRVGCGVWRRYTQELRELRKNEFDLIISCRFDPRDILQLKLLRSRARAGFGGAGGARWLDLDLGDPPSRTHGLPAHRDAAALAERITGTVPPLVPHLPVDGALRRDALRRLETAGFREGPLVAVSLGAGHPVRRWPAERLMTVLRTFSDQIGFLVVVQDPAEPLTGVPPLSADIPSLTWSTPLDELRALFALTDLVICNDSGVMHLASAAGCAVVAIFGPGSVEWYGPYGPEDEVVRIEPMPCRPCFDSCIYGEPLCMTGISTAMVESAVAKVLDRASSRRTGS